MALPEALPGLAGQLDARATRHETPCGNGTIVWHTWGESTVTPRSGGNGPPVVLLHGGSGSWLHWLRNIEALEASGRRVLVPDLPGMGDSALPPRGMDADSLPAPVELGLQQLIGQQACDLVGFSFGSMVAGFIAQRHPQRASRLVIVGAPGMGLWAGRKTLDLQPWRHLADPAARRAVHRGNLAILMLHHAQDIDEGAVAIQQYNVERDRTKARSIARTDALLLALREVRCPVSAIYGSHDALYTGRMDQVRGLLETLPTFGRFIEVADAGHWVQYERAGAFNAALLDILEAGSATTTSSPAA